MRIIDEDGWRVIEADCVEAMQKGTPDSIDSIVTDPPYLLGFLGKEWDKADKAHEWHHRWAVEAMRVLKPGAHMLVFGGTRTFHRLASAIEDAGFEIRDCMMWIYGKGFPKSVDIAKEIDKAAGYHRGRAGKPLYQSYALRGKHYEMSPKGDPITTEAQRWQGWGTALKPSWEPIIVARKPLSEKTLAKNVLRWGTGALNIDGCRVALKGEDIALALKANGKPAPHKDGRWPTNLILDEESATMLDGQHSNASRFFYTTKVTRKERTMDGRVQNDHPTVKPTGLMRYLVRLVTPPGGRVLDPFMGSGSTGLACIAEGFQFIGIERESHYVDIAVARLRVAREYGLGDDDEEEVAEEAAEEVG